MYEHDQAEATDKGPGALEELDRELERLEKSLAGLSVKVGPIRNRYANENAKLSEPRPEPSTELRGRVERLRDLVANLDSIQRDIDL
jgi:hypothetical protein